MANLLALGGEIIGGGNNLVASDIEFDNTGTSLLSTNVQDAIEELDNNFKIGELNGGSVSVSSGLNVLEVTLSGIPTGYVPVGILGIQFIAMDRSKIYLSHYYIDSTSHKAIVEVNGTGSTSGSLRIYSLLKKS